MVMKNEITTWKSTYHRYYYIKVQRKFISLALCESQVNHALLSDSKIRDFQTGKKISTFFNVKDKTVFNHQYDIVYNAKCPEKSCPYDNVNESDRRL